ncbi:hypothetical protein ES703_89608 [subsurface metagenome]
MQDVVSYASDQVSLSRPITWRVENETGGVGVKLLSVSLGYLERSRVKVGIGAFKGRVFPLWRNPG